MSKKSVLIIEDNPNLSELYEMAFVSASYRVFSAQDGLEGITQAADCEPQIILLDLMMPNMDGFEVLEALKKNTSLNSTVVITSNLNDPQHVERALSNGADMFIKKADFTPYETVHEVEKYLQGGQRVENLLESNDSRVYNILIVEDNEDQADLVTRALELKGMETTVASNGQTGSEMAVNMRPDLIFLDLMLPDISGFEVLKSLQKTANLAVPIIITSQLDDPAKRAEAESLGACGFLNKAEYTPEQMAERALDYLEAELMA